MATVSPFQINTNPGVREVETFWWQTQKTGGVGVANGDTVNALFLPYAYAHVCMQVLQTVPASTVIAVLGGVTSDVSVHDAILDSAGAAITLTAENDLVFLTGGVPPWLSFSVSGGAGGDMDVYLARKIV